MINKDNEWEPSMEFLTSGIVKEKSTKKVAKIQVDYCKGPGVVRNIMVPPKSNDLKNGEDSKVNGLGSGVVRRKEK